MWENGEDGGHHQPSPFLEAKQECLAGFKDSASGRHGRGPELLKGFVTF